MERLQTIVRDVYWVLWKKYDSGIYRIQCSMVQWIGKSISANFAFGENKFGTLYS